MEAVREARLDGRMGAESAAAEEKRLLNHMYVASGKAKAPAIQEYLETLLDSFEGKFIFFAHHACVLDAAEATMKKTKTKHIRIDGGTPVRTRLDVCDPSSTILIGLF